MSGDATGDGIVDFIDFTLFASGKRRTPKSQRVGGRNIKESGMAKIETSKML
jgi:hypothetical protein